MDYAAFKREIDKGKIRPVYLFTGEEDFLAETGVQAIIDKALRPDERSLNLVVFYGKDANGLSETLNSLPIFADHRVTVVRQAQDLKDKNLTAVLMFINDSPTDSTLILWTGKIDKRRSFFKEISKKTDPINCNMMKSGQLSNWMREYLVKWDKRLEHDAVSKLLSINWPSLRELAGELERLTLLVGDVSTIRLKDVEELGEVSFEFERWALTDAIGSGNIKAAQQAAKNLQYWSMKPTQIIGDLYRMFHKLWQLNWYLRKKKLNQAKDAIGLHPYVFKKYVEYARKINHRILEDGILRLYEADLNIKRGLRQDWQEVTILVLELAHSISRGFRR